MVDLGKWLNEQHSLPLEDAPAGLEESGFMQGDPEGAEPS
jgi:endogenous inhibitor of DNA gyrase (YacG/DUF329 family)